MWRRKLELHENPVKLSQGPNPVNAIWPLSYSGLGIYYNYLELLTVPWKPRELSCGLTGPEWFRLEPLRIPPPPVVR